MTSQFLHIKQLLLVILLFSFNRIIAQGEHGFRHPGGLHTQGDFDRVKSQIASGNSKVVEAYNKLKNAGYAQSGVVSYPVETIVRGGGVGENYINAARAATMAYQNGLRWKIEGNRSCAQTAVDILMAWAKTTKAIGGDSNYALASGLYGYQFAQAGELVRDFDGWLSSDFKQFQQWMIDIWYKYAYGFLTGRNGTWENGSKWWQSPGHYWSNWGLCNALCVASIGVLCDDVYIYNQGMSFFKYDQVGNFTDPPTMHEVTGHEGYDGTQSIWNDGLTEFLGNLVVTDVESELETGAYGRLGQMNESGRDAGHSAMALGLAVDIAKLGYSQGDDLFSYMNHRLASGIEFLAAQTQSVENLPWTNYLYGSNGYWYSDGRSWLMTGPAMEAHIRPCWGTVIGIYEGVKGVKMPFSEKAYNAMGIDEGGMGSTSGGYDHLGYSVLMNTRDKQLCDANDVPTELTPLMEYSGTLNGNLIPSFSQERSRGMIDGKAISHNELGGLVNSFTTNNSTTVSTGQTIRLIPVLPEGEPDTGQWHWDTGETSKEITVTTDKSYIYRVHYTNKRGIESELSFSIAVKGDCTPTTLTPSITYNGENYETTEIDVLYGKTVKLSITPSIDRGTIKWDTDATTESITTSTITSDRDFTVTYTNSGGAISTEVFHIHMIPAVPYTIKDDVKTEVTESMVNQNESVTLGLTLPAIVRPSNVTWSTGETGSTITISSLQSSQTVSATFTLKGVEYTYTFNVLVADSEGSRWMAEGNYAILHRPTGLYLTAHGQGDLVTFESADINGLPAECRWKITPKNETTAKYNITSLATDGNLMLGTTGKLVTIGLYSFMLKGASGTMFFAIYKGSGTSTRYLDVDTDGTLLTDSNTELTGFPFELIPLDDATGINGIDSDHSLSDTSAIYDLNGRRVNSVDLKKGIYIIGGKKYLNK